MAIFEIQGPDGKTYEVDALDMNAAVAAISRMSAGPQRNADGTYGQPPEGFVQNTMTGQMEDIRSPNNPNIPTGRAVAGAAGLAQGATFGASDEGTASVGTMMNPGSNYDYELERAREINRRAAEDHPWAYYGGLIPGAAASSYMLGRGLGINPTGPNLLNTSLRGAGIGAGEGTLYGFNTGEGGLGSRLGSAAREGAIGAGIGGAAPAVVAGLRAGANAVGDLAVGGVDALTGRASQGRANRALISTMLKSGRSLDDIADDVARAAREGQPEFRMMDAMGTAGQRRASGVVRAGGDGAEEIAQYLNQRQLDQTDRVVNFVDDAFGSTGTTAAKTRDSLTAARGAQADAAYAAARQQAGAVNLTPTIERIDDLLNRNPILGESALSNTEIGNRLMGLRGQMQAGGEQLIDFQRVLNIKQDMFTVMEGLRTSGKKVPKEMSEVYGLLDQALEASSDGYRAANDGFREASRTIEAVDTGADMARKGRVDDTVPAFQAMTPDQQGAARVGYANTVIDEVERNRASTSNAARQFNSTKRTGEAQAMATDPRLFGDRIARENTMWETQNRALQGSRTADNLQDIGELGPRAEIARALMDVGNLQFGQAAGRVGSAIAPAVTGMNESTRNLIARALMSDNPRQAMASAMRQEAMSQTQRRIAESLMRALGREVTP